MGVFFSWPLATTCDIDDGLSSAIVKSTFLDDDYKKTTLPQSINFGDQNFHSKIFKIAHSESEFISVRDADSIERFNQSPGPKRASVAMPQAPIFDLDSPEHEAAVKLQKVYKSFRTRRKLADCAIVIEQSWWELLDYAELKHSSISYFNTDKHETAISRWSRARTRAAKVGKGLSKNGKAQKLALQHWLEAIDSRHRYGHNLHFYYVKWLHSQSKEPFFYWLDIGEGKEVNLVEKCPRPKLHQQCIKYLGPMERKAYEVALEDGKLCYKQTREWLNTTGEPKAKWIFVLSTSRTLYVGKKRKGTFQHSSFLAGGATLAAGRIVVEKGFLKAAWPHSGHYQPTAENFQDFVSFLKENNMELNDVKLDSSDEEEQSGRRAASAHLRSNSSGDDLGGKDGADFEENDVEYLIQGKGNTTIEVRETSEELLESNPVRHIVNKPTVLEIPSNHDLIEELKAEPQAVHSDKETSLKDSPKAIHETVEEIYNNLRPHLLSEDHETGAAKVSRDFILGRITPSKRSESCQFLKQLSGTWSTGAGPRIGCLRDYPSELQSHALEEANLSPRSTRSAGFGNFSCSPKISLCSNLSPRSTRGAGFDSFSCSPRTGLSAELRGTPFSSCPEKGNLLEHRVNHPVKTALSSVYMIKNNFSC